MRTICLRPAFGLSLLLSLACGCGSSSSATSPSGKRAGSFESDLPGQAGVGRGLAMDAGSEGAGFANDTGAKNDAARAIVEADVIQQAGDKLYTLSRVAGLTVIDVANPDSMAVLGRYRELPADPFEMYLRDDVVIAMFSSWGQYVDDGAGGYQWVQTSKVVALDATEPAKIARIGSFDVPGQISDSRIVGDVLYVVGYQDGYCWDCAANQPRTSIVSLDVSDVRAMTKVDELTFDDGNNQWGWGRRSVTVTTQRMYVAGPEYGTGNPQGSTIQVVDISDPAGDLVPGAEVEVAGQISSRWQMDEFEGVLRVVSQPPQWNLQLPPFVQTFRVESSATLTPLGKLLLSLPRPEQLQSTRFDGTRGYVITAERTDPLFTLDLSDPALPKQMGELEMPGFIYHMEPRGDRVIGLGFDQGNPDGSITVSVFDVSDLSRPTMLSRANFGGSWGQLPEDQDRIHKVLRILPEQQLILVPFSGWDDSGAGKCGNSSYVGGVQLIDLVGDSLARRGRTQTVGEARRALIVAERLLSVSDERVEAFDIGDRDAPRRTDSVVLARNVEHAFLLDNGAVARVDIDWWSSEPRIDLVSADQATDPEATLGGISLPDLAGRDSCNSSFWVERAFATGNQIEIVYNAYDYTTVTEEQSVGVAIVDASDPKAPKLVSNTSWPRDPSYWWYDGYYGYGYYGAPQAIVRTDSALVALESGYDYEGDTTITKPRLRVIDLRDPQKPATKLFALPRGRAYSGLLASGDDVFTSHYALVDGDETRARFYLDRFDLSDPGKLQQATPVNIPGALVHVDNGGEDLLTSELRRVVAETPSYEKCYARFAWSDFLPDDQQTWEGPGTCTGYTQRLHLVSVADGVATLEDSLQLDDDEQLSQSSQGDGVVFATLGRGGYAYGRYAVADCFGPCGGGVGPSEPQELLALSGFGEGELTAGKLDVAVDEPWWGFWGTPAVHAQGTRALLLANDEVAIVEGKDASAPALVRKQPLLGSPRRVQAAGDRALLSLGMQGVQWVDVN